MQDQGAQLAQTRTTTKIIPASPNPTDKNISSMASPSHRSIQVSSKPHPNHFFPMGLLSCAPASLKIRQKKNSNTHITPTQGEIQRSEIVRTANRPPKKRNTSLILIAWCMLRTQSQDLNQDMEDSNSPNNNNKRNQIAIYQPGNRKRRRATPITHTTRLLT